jgi:sugar phosphate isomerase/epimerase
VSPSPARASRRPFGVSSYLFHGQRLDRQHLLDIAAHGFDGLELFATRTHFDYHSATAIGDLQEWLAQSALDLQSVHAPITDSFVGGRFGQPFVLTSADADVRATAVAEVEGALHIARRIPYAVLVLHLGIPRGFGAQPGDHSRDAARRSIDALLRTAEPLGVRLALEIIPNDLSKAAALAHFIDDVIDGAPVGVCFDFGHAHLVGDVVEQIEAVSEYLVAAHVHDNQGRSDEHLMPFDGTIDWAAALTTIQKVGYDGALVFELAARVPARAVLEQARRARSRMEQLLAPALAPGQ